MEQNNKIKAWHPDFEDWIELSKITIQCIIQNTQFNSFYPGSLHVFYSTPFPQETISRILIQTNQCTYIFFKVCMQYKRKWIDLNVYYMQYLFYYNSIHRMWGKKTCLSWLGRCTAMRIPRSGLQLDISTYPPLKTRRKVQGKRFSTSCF